MYSAIMNAIIDKLQFHFNRSIFNSKHFSEQWWNPAISWKNKYKDDLKTERFLGAKTIFVWITDAWHFLENAMICSFILAFMPYTLVINLHNNLSCFVVNFLIYRFIFAIVEEVFFRWALEE